MRALPRALAALLCVLLWAGAAIGEEAQQQPVYPEPDPATLEKARREVADLYVRMKALHSRIQGDVAQLEGPDPLGRLKSIEEAAKEIGRLTSQMDRAAEGLGTIPMVKIRRVMIFVRRAAHWVADGAERRIPGRLGEDMPQLDAHMHNLEGVIPPEVAALAK